jgi:hypothetical protein
MGSDNEYKGLQTNYYISYDYIYLKCGGTLN